MKTVSRIIKTEQVAIGLLTLAIFAFVTASVFAQESVRKITITPTIEVASGPGTTKEGTFKVVNEGTTPLSFNAVVRDFIVEDSQGTPTILPPGTFNEKYSASSWIGVTPSNFTIAPGETQVINYYLQVPADAAPGGHYAAVINEPSELLDTIQGSGTGVSTQLGTLFYIDVPGDIREEATVSQFETKGFMEYGPINVTTEIQNNGDLHIRPRGTITLSNIFGRAVEIQNLNENNIFPEKSFVHENTFGKKLMMGIYKVELAASYGKAQNLPLTASVTVLIFPWKVALVAGLIIAAIILGVVVWKRRKNKKDQGKNPEGTTTITEDHPTPQS